MSRGLTAAIQDELAKVGTIPVFFAEIAFSSGTVRFWSGIGPITWNSQTWTGVGALGGISRVKETSSVQADNFVLELTGIPSSILGQTLDEVRHGKAVTVWAGFLESGTVIADPFVHVSGFTDKAEIEDAVETFTIRLNCENELAGLKRARERRYTPEDQKSENPTDLGFDFVPSLQEKNVIWGNHTIPQQGSGGAVNNTPNPAPLFDGTGGLGGGLGGPGF